MATLKTLGWTTTNGKKSCNTLVIPLPKINFIQAHDDGEGKGDTCLVSISDTGSLHVDIPLKQMRKILDEHHRDPTRNFDTHPDFEDESPKTKPGSDRHGKK